MFRIRKSGYSIGMKLYVDDTRDAPHGWTLARSYRDAVRMLRSGEVDAISLDHDLGGKKSGNDIAWLMVSENIWPKEIRCHSMNPVGKYNIISLLEHYAPKGVTIFE
jgi:hypothetical protein